LSLGLDAWWDEPAYQASRETFSERGTFILGKLEAHDAAKLKDVLADVYRDAVPDRLLPEYRSTRRTEHVVADAGMPMRFTLKLSAPTLDEEP
jgi:hypothetical protein